MLKNIEACEWLTGALHGLEAPNFDANYAKMRAVCTLPFFLFLPILFKQLCGLANYIQIIQDSALLFYIYAYSNASFL